MKTVKRLHEKICTRQNFELADERARKNKTTTYGVRLHDINKESNLLRLQQLFSSCQYKTSEYETFTIYEPKEREIFRLPYFPDRIAHHALMNELEYIWVNIFTKDTYSCIKGRGIHACANSLKKDLQLYPEKTIYCLKMDIRKFYPSINHDILKVIIRKKIQDKYVLKLLDEIIDSADGVPIGNYLSQYFANLYLTYFDHWLKEECKVRFYYRYADDMVILSDSKEFLHNILCAIKIYLRYELDLKLKPNYQIFPVEKRGIDFVGYVFRHNYTLLRKSIKQNILKVVKLYKEKRIDKEKFYRIMSSYRGWLKYCDSRHLCDKIFRETHFRIDNWDGSLISLKSFNGKMIYLVKLDYRKSYFILEYIYKDKSYKSICRNRKFMWYLLLNFHFPGLLRLRLT